MGERPGGDPIPRFGDRRRMRVGLLGGSFNPAHEGHLHVAELARRRLRLDQVWLVVSPGNVLKPRDGMASFPDRLAGAAALSDRRWWVATGIEAAFGTRFTVDTLRLLRRRFPLVRFVWIMGADLLEQLPRWRHWAEIARLVPFVVLPRPLYSNRALAGRAAHRLGAVRRPARQAALLPGAAPGWTFLPAPQTAISATAIRLAAEGTSVITKTPKLAASPARHTPAPRKKVVKPKIAEAGAAAPGSPRKKTIAAGPKKAAAPRVKKPKLQPSELDRLQGVIVASLEDDKAENVVTMDLTGKAMFCDRMVIASGLADRQISAMAQHLEEKLKEAGLKRVQIEGAGGSDWVLIDAGDIVVHLFKPDARTLYGLEKMWGQDLDEAV